MTVLSQLFSDNRVKSKEYMRKKRNQLPTKFSALSRLAVYCRLSKQADSSKISIISPTLPVEIR